MISPPLFVLYDDGYNFFAKDSWKEVSRMLAVMDSGLYIDSGLLSGLQAMSEKREVLDELYGDLD